MEIGHVDLTAVGAGGTGSYLYDWTTPIDHEIIVEARQLGKCLAMVAIMARHFLLNWGMNRILSFVLVCTLWSISLSGQDFVIGPNPSSVEGAASNVPLIAYAELTNNTDEVQMVLWERIVEDIPNGWTTNVCTSKGCIPAEIPAGDFSILPGESLNVDIQFNTLFIGGEGLVEVRVSFESDTTNSVIVTYHATAMATSLKVEPDQELLLFPNPVENFFEIKNGEKVHQIKIINIFGHQQLVDMHPFSKVNVQDFAAGLYHVILYDKKGVLLKTVPLTVF